MCEFESRSGHQSDWLQLASGHTRNQPWDFLVWDIPGVLIGGQIGPRLQRLVPQQTMRRAIAVLFIVLAIAMLAVALQRTGLI
jgi:uncharacterized membrane protein YfcA